MNFADLYRLAFAHGADWVPVEMFRKQVIANHPGVGNVQFWACKLDQNISFGHMLLELERSSPYDDPYILASVRFDHGLDRFWRRFVCAKELMHVFDSNLQKTSSKDKFIRLMEELENGPIAVDQSPMFVSENNAEWMAILALCPLATRTKFRPLFEEGKITREELSSTLQMPIGYLNAIMSDAYIRALEILTGETNGGLKKKI